MITFATPLAFLLILPWIFATYRLFRRAKSQAVPFPGLSKIPVMYTWRQRIRFIPSLLLTIGLLTLIIAAARPQTQLSQSHQSTDAIAIEMAVDISGSMRQVDYADSNNPLIANKTRLDVVKETFSTFVAQRPSDLIGLVAFGGYATTRCPLTLDHTALQHILTGLEIPDDRTIVDQTELQTAIGDGLAMACARLSSVTNVESRIVILLSDGESNAGIITPEQATAIAKQQGVKVYTIGIGTTTRVQSFFGTQEYKIDETAMKQIAAQTGGLYFNAANKKGLEKALEEIDTLQKTAVDQTIYFRYNEHFRPFLVVGIACSLLALLLSAKSRRSLF